MTESSRNANRTLKGPESNSEQRGPEFFWLCAFCNEKAAGLGISYFPELDTKNWIAVCNDHRGTAEYLAPIPPKWEPKYDRTKLVGTR